MSMKWIELYKGLMEGAIPFGSGGYIINVRFQDNSDYTIFETIGFDNVKNIYQSDNSVTFQSDGYKIFITFEPKQYTKKYQEPYLRDSEDQIPLRWNEVDILDLPKKDRVFVSKEPYVSYGSFNIEVPEEGRFVYYIFQNDNIDDYACEFVTKILKDDFKLDANSIKDITTLYRATLEYFHKAISENPGQ